MWEKATMNALALELGVLGIVKNHHFTPLRIKNFIHALKGHTLSNDGD